MSATITPPTAATILLLVLWSSGGQVVEAASLRDYANSAVAAVGLDSLLRSPSPSLPSRPPRPADRCCDAAPLPTLLNPLSPCPTQVVQAKSADLEQAATSQQVLSVIRPADPCPATTPVPNCVPCPLTSIVDRSRTAAWNVAQQGRDLASRWTGILAAPAVYTNKRIADGAALLPDLLSAQGRILGSAIATPVQFVTGANSVLAKGVSGVMVGVPVAIGTGIRAGAAGIVEAVRELRDQGTLCACRDIASAADPTTLQLGLRLPVRPFGLPSFSARIPCPASCPAGQEAVLLAAGSDAEETRATQDPATDSPVTQAPGSSSINEEEKTMVTSRDESALLQMTEEPEMVADAATESMLVMESSPVQETM